jgi:hypothetical protein
VAGGSNSIARAERLAPRQRRRLKMGIMVVSQFGLAGDVDTR